LPLLAARVGEVASDAELLIVDGGSKDNTLMVAQKLGLRVVRCRRGRGGQMNLGAAQTRGEILLFLHADTVLPEGASQLIAATLADPSVALGAFGFGFSERGLRIGLVQFGARLRSRVRASPYGDQALFLRREVFDELGGFAELSALEDMDMVKRARDLGRIVVRPEVALTSARRYLDRGPLRLMVRHWFLSVRFFAGWRPKPGEDVRR
jgi:rSAM/selenodomain-associated transferase 2